MSAYDLNIKMGQDRLQKILAQAGIASRRKAEELILEGLVTINGKLAKLGDKADFSKDAIKVKGKLLRTKEAPVYLAFHKPKGVISMMADPQGRPNLSQYFSKVNYRLFPVGRLDFNSEGLLLLTNDGEFAHSLQKRAELMRTYEVKVKGHILPEKIERLKRGGHFQGKVFRPKSIKVSEVLTSKSKIEIILNESGSTDLKAFFETRGFFVERMVRTAIGPITLKALHPGEYRFLKKGEILALTSEPKAT